jgi:hypothetical protein
MSQMVCIEIGASASLIVMYPVDIDHNSSELPTFFPAYEHVSLIWHNGRNREP